MTFEITATHEPGAMGSCVYDAIEDLQDDIGHPLTAELAMDLYSALLCAGVEPDDETSTTPLQKKEACGTLQACRCPADVPEP